MAVLALLLVGLLVFFVMRPVSDAGQTNASATTGPASSAAETSAAGTTAATSAQSAEKTTASNAETTSAAPGTTAAAGNPLTASNIEQFLVSYHRQVLTDPHAAYARTGPTLRAAISENNYVKYWSRFSDVRVSGIQAQDGQNSATGTLTWTYDNGRVESSRRRFTFLVQGGQLILDSDRAA
jgi:hypothetical protein